MARTVTLVIDTDPGIDDAVALALAARSPELTLAAVTTTYGNASLPETTRNARTVLSLAGRPEVPVWPGAAGPLARDSVPNRTLHGPTGAGYAPVDPAPAVTPDPTALLQALRRAPEPVVLVTLGPLTNLALALERDAALVRRAVVGHLAMLGNFGPPSSPERAADFNTWADPEAARRVLEAGLPSRLVPLDVTRHLLLSPALLERLSHRTEPWSRWLEPALEFSIQAHRRVRGMEGCVLHDVVPIAEVLAPGVLEFRERPLEVDLDEGPRRGHTRERPDGRRVPVAVRMEVERVWKLLARVLPV
jgi:pyrimidine-specific ribonucleoside hydrolase